MLSPRPMPCILSVENVVMKTGTQFHDHSSNIHTTSSCFSFKWVVIVVVVLLFSPAVGTLVRVERKTEDITVNDVYGRMTTLIIISHLGTPKTSSSSKDVPSEAWQIVVYEISQYCVLSKHICKCFGCRFVVGRLWGSSLLLVMGYIKLCG